MFVVGSLLIAAAPVVIEAPVEAPLLARIRGQTSDLPWSIEVVEPLAPRSSSPLVHARRVADIHDARVVMGFEALATGGVRVQIAQAAEGRLLTRTLEPPDGDLRLARSALFETVALAVRSSLRALIAGGQIGVALPEATASSPTPPSPRPSPPSSLPRSQPGLTYAAHLGWQAAFDGQSPVQQGLEAGAVVWGGPWFGGLSVATSVGASLQDAQTSISMARHTATLVGGRTLWGGDGLRLSLAATVGAAIYRRTTTALGAGVLAAEGRLSPAVVAGTGLQLDWLFAGFGRHMGLRLSAGADGLVGVPRLQYLRGDVLEVRSELWVIQPRIALALLFSSGD